MARRLLVFLVIKLAQEATVNIWVYIVCMKGGYCEGVFPATGATHGQLRHLSDGDTF